MKYFSYGANMDPRNMERRCGAPRALGVAILPDHRLTFRRWRPWRTGVGHVEPAQGERVWGVLWDIDPEHERALDRYEMTAQNLYTKTTVRVQHATGEVEAMMYVAVPLASKRPSRRYLRLIVRGAQAQGLPPAYVAHLRSLRRG